MLSSSAECPPAQPLLRDGEGAFEIRAAGPHREFNQIQLSCPLFEGIKAGVAQVELEADRPAPEVVEAGAPPGHFAAHRVAVEQGAVRLAETLLLHPVRVEDGDRHLSTARRGVDPQGAPLAAEGFRYQGARFRSGVDRHEAVEPQLGEVDRPAAAGGAVLDAAGGVVEPELVPHLDRGVGHVDFTGVVAAGRPVLHEPGPIAHPFPADAVAADRELDVDGPVEADVRLLRIGVVHVQQADVETGAAEHRHAVELRPGGVAFVGDQHLLRVVPVDEVVAGAAPDAAHGLPSCTVGRQ